MGASAADLSCARYSDSAVGEGAVELVGAHRADVALDDVAVDVGVLLERDAQLVEEGLGIGWVLADVDADEAHAIALVAGGLERGQLGAARRTPRRPQVDDRRTLERPHVERARPGERRQHDRRQPPVAGAVLVAAPGRDGDGTDDGDQRGGGGTDGHGASSRTVTVTSWSGASANCSVAENVAPAASGAARSTSITWSPLGASTTVSPAGRASASRACIVDVPAASRVITCSWAVVATDGSTVAPWS